jgi:hypothetical protein
MMKVIFIKVLFCYLLIITLFILLFIFNYITYPNNFLLDFFSINKNLLNISNDYWNELFIDNINIIKFKDITFNTTLFIEKKINLGFNYNPNYLVEFSGSTVKLSKEYGYYFHISRLVYFENCEDFREKYGLIDITCPILKSFIYASILDNNFQMIDNFKYKNLTYPKIIEIDSPDVGFSSGPEDARVFLDPWLNINLIFNMKDKSGLRSMWTYNLTTEYLKILNLHFNNKIEKNWTPFFKNNLLYYIPSFKNTKSIVDCNNNFGNCSLSYSNNNFSLSLFRGGSSLQIYKEYFVGMARSSAYCKCGKIYRPNLIILSPNLDIIYISEPINYTYSMFIKPFFNYESIAQLPDPCIDQLIMTPLTLTPSWNNNIWITEVSLSDQKNIIILLEGLDSFLDTIINKHKNYNMSPQYDLLDENKECNFIELN